MDSPPEFMAAMFLFEHPRNLRFVQGIGNCAERKQCAY
jgi:hypothetical protein